MANKHEVKVIVLGQVLTLKSDDSIEHIQRVATYVNMKMDELMRAETSKQLNTKYMNIFLALNIADDYMQMKEKVEKVHTIADHQESNNLQLQNRINELLEEKAALINELHEVKIQLGVAHDDLETALFDKETLSNEIQQIKEELSEYVDVFNEN